MVGPLGDGAQRLVPGDHDQQGDAENVDWMVSRLRHRDARHGHGKHQRVEREMHGLGQRPFVARDRNQQRRRNRHHAAAKSKHGRCEDGDPRLLVNVDKFAAERRSAAATGRWRCLGAAAPIVRLQARWARHPCTPCANLRAGWSRPCSAPDRDRRNPRARCPVSGPNMQGIGPATAAITARSTGKTHVRRLRRNKGRPLPVRTAVIALCDGVSSIFGC